MFVVLKYVFDLSDLSSEFDRVVFVTNDVNVANEYKGLNDGRYIGYDRYCEVKIVESYLK